MNIQAIVIIGSTLFTIMATLMVIILASYTSIEQSYESLSIQVDDII